MSWLQPGGGPEANGSTPTAAIALEQDWSWSRMVSDFEMILRARRGLEADLKVMRAMAAFQRPGRRDRELFVGELEAAVALWRRVVDRWLALNTLITRYNRFDEVRDAERRSCAFVAAYAVFAAVARSARAWLSAAAEPGLIRALDGAQPDLGLSSRSLTLLRSAIREWQPVLEEAKAYAARGKGRAGSLEGAAGLRRAGLTGGLILEALREDTEWIRPRARGRAGAPKFQPLWPRALNVAAVWTGRGTALAPEPQAGMSPGSDDRYAVEPSLREELARWFPGISTSSRPSALISPAQLAEMLGTLEPGDIVLMRRERYIEEPGIGGWWHGAALYVGTPDERRRATGSDGLDTEINARWPVAYWGSLALDEGAPRRLIVASPAGVETASLERAGAADSLAVLRPRLPLEARTAAVRRAFEAVGRPYDETFDAADPSALFAMELILWAYPGMPLEPRPGTEAGPPGPNDLARTFDAWQGLSNEALNLVTFLDGQETQGRALVRGAADFRPTWRRSRWRFEERQAVGAESVVSSP